MASPAKKKRELVNLEGYVNFVGSPRKSKQKQKAEKKEIEYFEVSLNCQNSTIRAVCYDIDRRPLMQKFNEESTSCCMLNAEKSDEDVIILDDTIVKQKKVAFENKTFEPEVTSLMSVLQESPIWARVTVLGRIYDLQELSTSSRQKTRLREGKIIDKSNISRQITFFDHFDKIDEGKVYKITNVVVSKFDKKKVLKVSENCSIQEVEDDIAIPKPTLTSSSQKCSGLVCMVDPKTLNSRFTCSHCEKEVVRNIDGLFLCCNNILIESEMVKKEDVIFMVKSVGEEDQKVLLNCRKQLLESMVGVKTTNALFLKLFMGSKVDVTYKMVSTVRDVVTISDCAQQSTSSSQLASQKADEITPTESMNTEKN